MKKAPVEDKIGMAMTQAFNDLSQYNDDLPLESRQLFHPTDSKRLKAEIRDLK